MPPTPEELAEQPDRTLTDTVEAVFAEGGILAQLDPSYQQRPGQRSMAFAIAEAIEARQTLMVDAGTGIGKTFAYLVPALLSGRRTLISTATRQLQDQLFRQDVPRIRQALGCDVAVAILKGRANYVCPVHLERALRDGRFRDPQIPARLRIIERFAAISDSGDRADCGSLSEDDVAWTFATSTRDNCLGQACPQLRQCPLMKARQQAQKADLLIVNHHLFCADIALQDDAMGDFLPKADILVFDEAHQLPDIATEFFGTTLSTRQLIDLGRESMRMGAQAAAGLVDWADCYRRLEQVAARLRLAMPPGVLRLGLEALLSNDSAGVDEQLGEVLPDIEQVLVQHAEQLQPLAETSVDLALLHERTLLLLERARQWQRAYLQHQQPATTLSGMAAAQQLILWAQTTDNHAQLRITPLSVAERFAEQREKLGGAWIFVSATLAVGGSMTHFAQQMGMPAARQLQVDSPFDYPRQAALWIPATLGNPNHADFPLQVAEQVWPLIRRNRGRAFVLCTTLRATRAIAGRLRELADADIEVLMQGDAPRHVLMTRFRQASAALLVGSMGFWEGVDIAGQQLSLVIIDKLPFAPPDDPIFHARSQALARAGQHPFQMLALPQAALALKQGAGRLIRTESDRGLLVICDPRLRSRSYGRDILANLPPFQLLESVEAALDFLGTLQAPIRDGDGDGQASAADDD